MTARLLPLLLLCIPPWLTFAQSKSDCLVCHGEQSLSMERKGKQVSLYVDKAAFAHSAHGDLDCVACHVGFNPADIPHARRIKPVDCVSCHDDQQFEAYSASVHGRKGAGGKQAAACVDCHTKHAIRKLTDESPLERKQFALETCSRCHANVEEKYKSSDHARAVAEGVKGAPVCIDCHDEHQVVSPADTSAQTNRRREAAMCLRCHLDNPEVRERVGPSAGFLSSYENSVHAHGLSEGKEPAATCTDCHGGHVMMKASNPASKVARANIAETCGRCHTAILEQYRGSIHGQALASGVTAAATCTDCHGEHNILSPKDARSPVSAKNIASQVCSPCHASVKLTQKYGLAGDRFQSFADSYHGLAGKNGNVEVANCASCHGVHDIKPSSDPTSRINKANLVKTCGTCHPGANANFTRGAVHVVVTSGSEGVLYIVSSGYIFLIVVVVGGMAFHNLLDFLSKARRKLRVRRGILHATPVAHRLYLRMSLGERVQHGLLILSFTLLVVSGFALKFPDAWWVAALRDFSPALFRLRGLIHRIAAVAMVLASLYHIYYISMVPRGKALFRDLLPVRKDLADAFAVLRYNLGLSRSRPLFGRFSYIEKSEYWALLWGTIVMTATGIILWFDNTFLGLLTKLWWDVAQAVHYYEAWLATLSIIVWHLYFVIFHPDVYPINLAFWKGTLTEEEMEEEHPLELEAHRSKELHEEIEEVIQKAEADQGKSRT